MISSETRVASSERQATNCDDRFTRNPQLAARYSTPDPPYRSLTVDSMTVEGFSRAAMQTYWRVPQLKLGFDSGGQPWEFMNTPTWCISHTHMDHILALPAYICRRRMMKMEPPTIFLPAHAVTLVEKLLEVYKHLDRGKLPCRLIGVLPNEEYELSRENVLTTVETFHSIRSVGYIVWERRKRLKPELQHLSQEQIRQLAVSGQEVSAEIRFPRVAYLGDSTIQGLDANPAMFDADILIMEMSFVAKCHRGDKLRRYGHVHLDDVIARQDKFRNKVIIASHFSTRCPDRVIKHIVAKRLPDMLDGRLILWF